MDNAPLLNQPAMVKLVVLSEGFAGKTCELTADKLTIGRVEDNGFQIPEGSISGRHCEVRLKEGKVYVKDLGSTNGTFIGGKKVNSEALLRPGKILRLGQVEIRLETEKNTGETSEIEKTIVLKQGGIKLGDLERPTQTAALGKDNLFSKRSNQVNKIFVGVAIVLVIVIIGILVMTFRKLISN